MIAELKFREDTRYGYAVARVRAMEAKLLDDYFFSRLDSESPAGALRLLTDTVYGPSFSTLENVNEFEAAFEQHLGEILDELQKMIEEPEIISVLRLQYDFHNLKPSFLAFIRRSELDPGQLSALGNLPAELLRTCIERNDEAPLSEFFGDVWEESSQIWHQQVEQSPLTGLNEYWDSAYWKRVSTQSHTTGNDFLRKYIQTRIDWENLERIVRKKILEEHELEIEYEVVDGGTFRLDLLKEIASSGLEAVQERIPMGKIKKCFSEATASIREEKADFTGFLDARLEWQEEFVKPTQYVVHGVEPLVALFIRKQMEVDRLRKLLARILYPVAETSAA